VAANAIGTRQAEGTNERIGVLLVDPSVVLRAGMRALLTDDQRIRIIGDADSADDAMTSIDRGRGSPTIVLAALELDGPHDVYWLIRSVREHSPGHVVLVTGTDLDTTAISRALFVGADGFINTRIDHCRIIDAVRRAAIGDIVLEGLPRGALGDIVEGVGNRRDPAPVLTGREREVLAAAAEGLTARQIARRLDVAERTVTTHLHHIYRKLGTNGRVAALSTAARWGLLEEAGHVIELPGAGALS
jgi:DNA-binding NarL/FixJ family response regulator